MEMKRITKKCVISASRKKVFEALTETINISQWSGDEAVMEKRKGGVFSLWSGCIQGVNQEVSHHRIVQNWKEKSWETYSIVTFNLYEENGTTTLELIHEGIPDDSYQSVMVSWERYYLSALKSFTES